MKVKVSQLEQTQLLAQNLANLLLEHLIFPPVLLYGTLGSGKTTFVRYFVYSFPKGEEAEVSSPSFNIVNLYPTQPEIAHFDLYRLQGSTLDESLEELFFAENTIKIVEWAEYLPESLLSENWLKIHIHLQKNERIFEFTGKGSGNKILSSFGELF